MVSVTGRSGLFDYSCFYVTLHRFETITFSLEFSDVALQICSQLISCLFANSIDVFLMIRLVHCLYNVIVQYAYVARYGAFFHVAELNEFRSFPIEFGTTWSCRTGDLGLSCVKTVLATGKHCWIFQGCHERVREQIKQFSCWVHFRSDCMRGTWSWCVLSNTEHHTGG